ncbi:MAG: hypothetical protein AB1349_03575 [Elusimicrobiota bacterium]
MNDKISDLQRKILAFINNSVKKRGFPPTVREIAKYFKFASRNTAHYHIKILREKGCLKFRMGSCNRRVSRGLKIKHK